METHLSLPELEAILQAARERQYVQNKFIAALKGVDLDEGMESVEERFDAIESRARAKAMGMSPEAYELSDIGVGVETE